MRQIQKLMSAVLATIIAVAIIPFASGKDVSAATEYKVQVNNVMVNDENKNDILGDGNLSYDPTTKKLTIKNNAIVTAVASKNSFNAAIVSAENLTICGKGTFYSNTGIGMICTGNVTIDKDAEIAICGEQAGLYDLKGDLIVNGKLTLKGGDSEGVAGIIAGSVTVDGENASLIGVAGEHGIVCEKTFSINSGYLSINLTNAKATTSTKDPSYGCFANYFHFGTDMQLTKPAAGKFKQDQNAEFIVNSDGSYATTIEVKYVEASSTPAFNYKASGNGTFEDFIERLYNIALGRISEPEGKEYWLKTVTSGQNTGADCAKGFLFSDEFINKGLSREQFVDVLYRTFFKREADNEGRAYWIGLLADGTSKQEVINRFIDSQEWCDICATYGVRSGAITAKASFPSENAKAFASGLYTSCLGREAETDGLNYWALSLTNQERSGYAAAYEFFNSAEFKGFNLDDTEFLKRVYLTFMLREADTDGLNYWLGRLKNGTTRDQVLAEFAYSAEFGELCNKYGIVRGV